MRRTVLAFDVGIKNMAYCMIREGPDPQNLNTFVYNEKPYEVVQLEKFSIGDWGTNAQKLVRRLCEELNNRPLDTPDVIVIENQLAQSSTLRILQFALQSYFMGRWTAMEVRFQDGDCKLKCCDLEKLREEHKEGKNKYRLNKKYAALKANELLKNTRYGQILSKEEKADDKADAMLHALYYICNR